MTPDEDNLTQVIAQDFDDMLSQEVYRDYLLEQGREEEAEAVRWLWYWKKRPQDYGLGLKKWWPCEHFDASDGEDSDPRSSIPKAVWDRLKGNSRVAVSKSYEGNQKAYVEAISAIVLAVRDGWKMWEWKPEESSTEVDPMEEEEGEN